MSHAPTPWTADRARRDPITGLPKKERGEESVVEFAERHGWNIRRWADQSMGYLETYRFVKGLDSIDITRWTNTPKEQLTDACVAGISLPNYAGFPIKERVERAIVGMDCTCSYKEGLLRYEQTPDPSCLIHGTQEERFVHEARGLKEEKAINERYRRNL